MKIFRLLPIAMCAAANMLCGATVEPAAALAAARNFLSTATARSVFGDAAEAGSVTARGNLYVASVSPQGHVLVAASDKASPVLGFSAEDFTEPEADSDEWKILAAADEAVAAAEADEARGIHTRWASIVSAPVPAARAKLKAAVLKAPAASAPDVEPFVTSTYNQCQPWNDLAPVVEESNGGGAYRARSLAGCVSIADAALFRQLRWPVYIARTDTVDHAFRGNTFSIRFDGSEPILWDALDDAYPTSGDLRGTLAEDKRYAIGRYVAWLNHAARMSYQAGESLSTKSNAAHGGERDWNTIGRSITPDSAEAAQIVPATLAEGIPVFVGVGGHAVCADGWKTEDGQAFVHLVYGYGGNASDRFYSLETGPVKYFWVEHYPRAKPQLDPVPRVTGADVELSWHFPAVYRSKISGFKVKAQRRTSAALADWTADCTAAATGEGFPQGVWSVLDDGSLYAGDGVRGWYQFAAPLAVTENSALSIEVRGGVDKDNIKIEICGEDGVWHQLLVPAINWSYWPGSWKETSCSLAQYAGQNVQLRIYKEDVLYNGQTAIRNFKVTNCIPLAGEETFVETGADASSATLSRLEAGSDYAFSVAPVFAEETLTTAETSDARIATVEGLHAIPGTATEGVADFTTEETSIVFDANRKATADSVLSFKWKADCVSDNTVFLYVTFTPEGGEAENLATDSKYYFEYGELKINESGEYEVSTPLASIAGQSGTLAVRIVCADESVTPVSAVSTPLTATNVESSNAAATETLAALGMPQIESVQFQADGKALKDLVDGRLADGAIGTMTILVKCSDAVETLSATPSHIELVDDENVHVEKRGGQWLITFDGTIPANRHRQRQILTLHATDSNGTTVHRDIEMRMTKDSSAGDGVADRDDEYIFLQNPSAIPAAVWAFDFADGAKRGSVTLNLNGNTIAEDGTSISKTAGAGGIDFAVAGGGASVLAVANVSGVATISGQRTATLATVSTTGTQEDAGIGIGSSESQYQYRGLLESAVGQWYTASGTFPSGGAMHSLAFSATASGINAWCDGAAAYNSTQVTLDGTAVTDLVLGGWKASDAFGATGAAFNHVAVFTNAVASANDVFNWNLTNMTGAVSLPSSGGKLDALSTGRDLGINLNGGRVDLDEPVHAAALFVQENTTLDVSVGASISSSRVLYVAPGKRLTVNVIGDATAIENAVAAEGGIYNARILQGANYGTIAAGELPALDEERYTVEFSQKNADGVYFRVTDKTALDIKNDSGDTVGYLYEAGDACLVTNLTGAISIPSKVQYVYAYGVAGDTFAFDIASTTEPYIIIYATSAAGTPNPALVITQAFAKETSTDGARISYTLPAPEFDIPEDGDFPAFSGEGEDRTVAISVATVPGVWYRLEYGDDLSFAEAAATEAVQPAARKTSTTFTAPATADKTFYRIRSAASKAALER